MSAPAELRILHIGSGNYRPLDRGHVTYGIWRELASGFRSYRVIARSTGAPADWTDGNLRITLIRSWTPREAEFVVTQFKAVPTGLRERPDVIVCQSPVAGGLAAMLIARFTGARCLVEFHGAEFFVPAAVGSRVWFLQLLSRWVLRRAALIRLLSQGMRERFAKRYGASLGDRTRILPPRVDLNRFAAPRSAERDRSSLRLAMVGAVNPNKGQLRLIAALQQAPFPVELHIAGEGSDLPPCRARTAQLATASSSLQVICHGPLGHAAVADLLRTCDVFVMYSRTEATPRAIMEAMAVGLPVITTDAGFCADIVEDGVEGIVLGSDPDREIVSVLERFNADRGLASRMGAAARERAVRDYDSVRLFEDYRRLIADTARR